MANEKEITTKDIKKFKNFTEKAIGWISRWPTSFLFETTYYCENNCPHCHSDCSTKYNLANHMPEADIIHFINEMNNDNCIQINFAGGEITSVEDINPGFVKRVVEKSLQSDFVTHLETNASWINDSKKAPRLLSDMCELYTKYGSKFTLQMSFDSYHKNCIQDVNRTIHELSEMLPHTSEPVFRVSVLGFNHEPEFKNNLDVSGCDNMRIRNESVWDLNCVGRAKINDLPHCRDTYAEFQQACAKDRGKFTEAMFASLYMQEDIMPHTMILFDEFGMATLMDVRNPANYCVFKTPYRVDGKYKTIDQIKRELVNQCWCKYLNVPQHIQQELEKIR